MSGVFYVFVTIISARACSLGSSKNFRKLNDQWDQWNLLDLWPFEIFDGEGELEAADVVEDDGGALLAIDHLYGA